MADPADDDAPELNEAIQGPLLTEIRERLEYGTKAWEPIRAQGGTDMRYVSGDPWAPTDRSARVDAGRPCLSLDEIGQYINQLVNDVRQNKRSIKLTPTGSGANDQTAELRGNMIRQIEYESSAQVVYTTTFENAVQRSYGFHQVIAEYLSDQSHDQVLRLRAHPNPDLVTPDPDALWPDGRDQQWCFVGELRDLKEFRREFPNAKTIDFSPELQALAPKWIRTNKILIAEYWKFEKTARQLLRVRQPGENGQPDTAGDVFADALPKDHGLEVLKSRPVTTRQVVHYLTNGVEILKKKVSWPGQWIPIVSCYGKILYLDLGTGPERTLLSLTRLARDPAMLYNYYRTTQAELVGMSPRVPVVGYVGQFRSRGADWQKASKEPVAFLEADAKTEATGDAILPIPQASPYDPHIQELEVGAEAARRAIQAAMGISPLPTAAQRQNEKSGVALRRIEAQSARGSFHFVDHYDMAIEHTGRILEDLIPFFYDTAREVGIRKPDDSFELVKINQDLPPPSRGGQPAPPPNDTVSGTHDATISTGPSYDSQREEASDTASSLLENPLWAPLLGPLAIKLKDLGPIGEEMARLMEFAQPPEVRQQKQAEQGGGPPPVPPEIAQKLAQQDQTIAQLKPLADDNSAKIQIERFKAQSAVLLQKMKDASAIAVAMINARAKGAASENEAQVEAIALQQRTNQAELDRQHEALMAGLEHGHAAAQADADRAHATQQADTAHAQNLEQQSQAAALQPAASSGDGQ